MLNKIVENSNLKKTKKIKMESRLVSTNENQLKESLNQFLSKCFKNKDKIDVNELNQLKYQLFLLLQYYEFFRIKGSSSNKISGENFAKVLISYVNIYESKAILDRLSNKEFKVDYDVNFNEYLCFFYFLSEFSQVKSKLKEKGITKEELTKLANSIINTLPDQKKRVIFTPKNINLIYEILDTDSKIFI